MRTPTTLQLSQHTSNTVTTKVSLNIFVKHTHTCTRTRTRTHNPHAQSHHWWRWKNRRERHEMFVAGATTVRENISFEGGLQRLEFKKITWEPCASFLLVTIFLHTPWWLILSVGNFFYTYSPMLIYMGSLCWFMQGAPFACPCAGLYGEFLLHAQCWFTCLVSLTHPMLASFSWEFLS